MHSYLKYHGMFFLSEIIASGDLEMTVNHIKSPQFCQRTEQRTSHTNMAIHLPG